MSDTTTPQAVEVNCETGVVTTRDLTADEIAAQAAATAQAEADRVAREAADAAAAAAKESANAKLAALGLTADEIAALSK